MPKFLPAAAAAFSFMSLLWVALAATPDAHIPRDWTKEPAIVEIGHPPGQIFAIGDVHGDFDRLCALLLRGGLIDTKVDANSDKPVAVRWTGGDSVLVVTGDMIDKGPHSVGVIRLLAALRESARRSGGQVVITMGNHEAEFLGGVGKTPKASAKAPKVAKIDDFVSELEGMGGDPASVRECRGDIGEFLCSLPLAAKVGDWFFSHGGNTAGRGLARLSQALEQGVSKDGFSTTELSNPDSLLEARLGAGNVWFHPSGDDALKTERGILTADAAALGVRHMVQGHQPGDVDFADGVARHKGEMFQRWGLLFLIDTGMSADIDDSKGALLRISREGKAVAVCPDGKETPLWDAISNPDTGHAGPCSH
jgi:hypothetical protein